MAADEIRASTMPLACVVPAGDKTGLRALRRRGRSSPRLLQDRSMQRTGWLRRCGAPGRTRTADAGLRTASLYPLSYGGALASSYAAAGKRLTEPAALQSPGDGVPTDDPLPHPARLPSLRRGARRSPGHPG